MTILQELVVARLSDLVSSLSKALGIPEPRLRLFARHTREGGFITTKGRGTSAAEMTTSDATNLVLAVMGTDTAKEVAKAVETFRRLVPYQLPKNWSKLGIGLVQDLPEDHTFGDAMEALIDAAIDGSVESFLTLPSTGDDEKGVVFPINIIVTIHSPQMNAWIIFTTHDNREWRVNYYDPDQEKMDSWDIDSLKRLRAGDLDRSCAISGVTFLAIGDLLRK